LTEVDRVVRSGVLGILRQNLSVLTDPVAAQRVPSLQALTAAVGTKVAAYL